MIVHIDSILIIGNMVTRNYIVRREMSFKEGDSLLSRNLASVIEIARRNIYNTTLFLNVQVSAEKLLENHYKIIVYLKERWFIFPIPQFQLVARSFNEWIHVYHGALARVNYGLNFTENNLTGRKDKFKLTFINGYSQNISALYNLPYINHKLVAGFSIGGGYGRTRELPYLTNVKNQQVFYRKDEYITNNWYVNAGYTIRKEIFRKQVFRVRYSVINVPDSIIFLNPNYLNVNRVQQTIPDITYQFYYDNADNILYPLTGHQSRIFINKRGLGWKGGINMLSIFGEYDQYFSSHNKLYMGISMMGQLKFPFQQSYINQRALGFDENYLRGLELYVIDGVAYSLIKFNVKKRVLKFTLPGIRNSKTYNRIPFTIYAKTYSDLGYVYSNMSDKSMLNNKFLYSYGFGFDVVTLYDFHLRLEYSFNQLGENGLFLHNGSGL